MLPFFKTIFKEIGITSGFLFIAVCWVIGQAYADVGIITVDRLNLRPQPGIKAAPIKVLIRGNQVQIIEKKGDWLKVRQDDVTGYVRNSPRFLHVLTINDISENEGNAAQLEETSEAIGKKIVQSKDEIKRVTEKEQSVLERLDIIEQKIMAERSRISNLQDELSVLDERIAENHGLTHDISNRITLLYDYAKKRLTALYKMNQLDTLSVLVSAKSLSDMFFRNQALEMIFVHDEAVRNQLLSEQAYLQELTDQLAFQRNTKQAVEQKLSAEINKLSQEKENRAQLLAAIQSEKSLKLFALKAFEQAATFIEEKIKHIEQHPITSKGDVYQPERHFSAFKGLLKLPVNGKIILGFGPYRDKKLDVDHFSNGINIQAEMGEPIHAVSDGKIIFSSWFKTYGNMIIIDHGFHFYTVYAHAQELFKAKGDRVKSREVIATVGDTGSISGPKLYFEVRHHGKPIDPAEWINKG
jgi:septal ring factor EnvC (AmiA/AmiB activator)